MDRLFSSPGRRRSSWSWFFDHRHGHGANRGDTSLVRRPKARVLLQLIVWGSDLYTSTELVRSRAPNIANFVTLVTNQFESVLEGRGSRCRGTWKPDLSKRPWTGGFEVPFFHGLAVWLRLKPCSDWLGRDLLGQKALTWAPCVLNIQDLTTSTEKCHNRVQFLFLRV